MSSIWKYDDALGLLLEASYLVVSLADKNLFCSVLLGGTFVIDMGREALWKLRNPGVRSNIFIFAIPSVHMDSIL